MMSHQFRSCKELCHDPCHGTRGARLMAGQSRFQFLSWRQAAVFLEGRETSFHRAGKSVFRIQEGQGQMRIYTLTLEVERRRS